MKKEWMAYDDSSFGVGFLGIVGCFDHYQYGVMVPALITGAWWIGFGVLNRLFQAIELLDDCFKA